MQCKNFTVTESGKSAFKKNFLNADSFIHFHNEEETLTSIGPVQLWQCVHKSVTEEPMMGASLVAQWLRIRLPMQETRVQALVWEDPTCRGATKPMHRNYWTCVLEPASHNYWACVPQLLKPAPRARVPKQERSHRNEKPVHHNEE